MKFNDNKFQKIHVFSIPHDFILNCDMPYYRFDSLEISCLIHIPCRHALLHERINERMIPWDDDRRQ